MTNPNTAKSWPGVLDSSPALKKYFYPQKSPSSANASTIVERDSWPLNGDWQLARDPSRLADVKKKVVALPKRLERKIYAKPGLVELTKRAVQTERAQASALRHQEMLQARKLQEKYEKLQQKPKRSGKAHLCKPKVPAPIRRKPQSLSVHRFRDRAVRTERAKVSGIKYKEGPQQGRLTAGKPQKRPPLWAPKTLPSASKASRPGSQPKTQTVRRWRNARRRNIVVVDAKVEKQPSRMMRGGADKPLPEREATSKPSSRHQMNGRAKKSYGVPLCSRPTKIMGMGYSYSRQMQMRQEQLCQQPEYRDQYRRMLHQQQRQQEMRQLEQNYGQMATHPYAILSKDLKRQHQLQQQMQVNPPYAVPTTSQLKRLREGNRLCGNFYYD